MSQTAPTPDARKPWEKSSWACSLATVTHEGMLCPPTGRCPDCPLTRHHRQELSGFDIRWIPVTERLPQDQADVLTLGKHGMQIALWSLSDRRWLTPTSRELQSVTHWALLSLPDLDSIPDEGRPAAGSHPTPGLSVDWVRCPICDEPDMRKTTDGDGNSLIHCVNHACRSNGGSYQADAPEQWQPMSSAPTDGTIVRLLVDYRGDGCHPLVDAEVAQTVGGNTDGNTGLSEGWKFAGWSWEQDCFTEGKGKPIGWLPFDAPA